MNVKNFVTYKQAVSLKQISFRETCLYHYNDRELLFSNSNSNGEGGGIYVEDLECSHNTKDKGYIDAPTLYQAAEWLRNKGYSVEPHSGDEFDKYEYQIDVKTENPYTKLSENEYSSYIEALSAGIDKCLEILKE